MLRIKFQMTYGIDRASVRYLSPSGPSSGGVDHPAVYPTQTQGSELHPGEALEAHITLISGVWKFY